ncbi:MAG: NUDIX domain-containing protein [Patescibacteria group bacterium]
MSGAGRSVAYDGSLFRVEHQPIKDRVLPYEFVHRIGATTVLPIAEIDGEPKVLGIRNTRAYYGVSLGLPGGNAGGGFDNPEHPTDTGLRELREETGYGYREGVFPDADTFLLRSASNSILYNRSFSVVRGIEYVGGEVNSAHEVVEVQPVSLEEYMNPLFVGKCGELYPEINLAIVNAGLAVGRKPVLDWVMNGSQSEYTEAVVASFEPWMSPVAAD